MEKIALKINESVQIDLPGKGTSGYAWHYKPELVTILRITNEYIPGDIKLAGGRSTERFTITGVSSGTCSVTFLQTRSWEKDKPPLDSKEFQITVGKDLTDLNP